MQLCLWALRAPRNSSVAVVLGDQLSWRDFQFLMTRHPQPRRSICAPTPCKRLQLSHSSRNCKQPSAMARQHPSLRCAALIMPSFTARPPHVVGAGNSSWRRRRRGAARSGTAWATGTAARSGSIRIRRPWTLTIATARRTAGAARHGMRHAVLNTPPYPPRLLTFLSGCGTTTFSVCARVVCPFVPGRVYVCIVFVSMIRKRGARARLCQKSSVWWLDVGRVRRRRAARTWSHRDS